MRYYSEFTSIDGTDYGVEIITNNNSSSTRNFTLGGNPFVTQMDSDGKTIFAPIKTTGATIEMVVDNMPFDIYTPNNQGTKVTLKRLSNNKVEWVGYTTPCAYTQGFDRNRETLEIECIDGLASLQNVPYSSDKSIDNFLNIIFKVLKKANCYKTLYVSDNIKLTQIDNTDILNKLRISQQNFYEKKDYENQADDEVAWSCYDVLYEIMQYMGYTVIADGEDVIVLDYDAILNGINTYFVYDISGNSYAYRGKQTRTHSYRINENSYSKNGTNISLTELFNSCTVIDEFNEIDSIYEDGGGIDNSKNLTNITATTDATLKDWMLHDWRFLESDVFTVKNKLNQDESFIVTLTKDDNGRIFFVIAKFYKNPLVTTYHYSHNNGNPTLPESGFNPMKFSKLWDAKGANIVGYFSKEIDSKKYNEWRAEITSNWDSQTNEQKLKQYGKLCNIANIGNKTLTPYIVCLNQDTNHIPHDKVKDYPFFKIIKDVSSIFGGDGGYLVLKGSLIRHYEYNAPFPIENIPIHKDTKKTSIYADEGYIWAQMKWGNQYWQCEGSYKDTGKWVNTPSYFKIFYGDPTVETRCDTWLSKEIRFYNNCGAIWGIGNEEGYYIPVPENGNLNGNVELTIYANKDTKGKWARNNKKDKSNSYSGMPPKVMMYKDIDIVAGYSDDSMNDDAANSDTVYTNDVSTLNNINSMDEIKFKICTYDNKTPSYSTVDYLVNGTSIFLDTTYNQATRFTLRQEQHFVVKCVSQYQKPRIQFECNLKNNLGLKPYSLLTDKTLTNYKFIIDTMDIDYKYNQVKLNIIEKTDIYE